MTNVSPELDKQPKRKIAFVHIGKSAGTTAGQMMRNACYRATGECIVKTIRDETEISLQTEDYYHCRKPDVRKSSSFIVAIRDPIDRAVSWFLYAHPKNKMLPHVNEYSEKLYQCYDQINDLTTVGLSPTNGKTTAVENECKKFAKECIGGKLDNHVCPHMSMNYKFYTEDLLKEENKEIFVLRTEAFWEDWQKINTMLGGGNVKKIKDITHSKNQQPVTSRDMSKDGLRNLCRVLCTEIQHYTQLIKRSVNLDPPEKARSLARIWEKCPIETTSSNCNENEK